MKTIENKNSAYYYKPAKALSIFLLCERCENYCGIILKTITKHK